MICGSNVSGVGVKVGGKARVAMGVGVGRTSRSLAEQPSVTSSSGINAHPIDGRRRCLLGCQTGAELPVLTCS
jgi:hypothetical protein